MREPAPHDLPAAPGLLPADGVLHLFVAQATGRGGCRIRRFVSRDAWSAEARGELVLPTPVALGGVEAAQRPSAAPSSRARDGRYRVFYPRPGDRPAIAVAASDDLERWATPDDAAEVHPEAPWYREVAPGPDPAVWRDPFILYDPVARRHQMLLSAQRGRGREGRRGCIAAAVSDDMASWELLPPLLAPGSDGLLASPCAVSDGARTHLLYHLRGGGAADEVRWAVGPSAAGPFDVPADDVLFCGPGLWVRPVAFGGGDLLLFACARPAQAEAAPRLRLWPAPLDFRADGAPVAAMPPRILDRGRAPDFRLDMDIESRELLVRLLPQRARDFLLSALVEADARRAGLLVRTSVTGRDNDAVWLDLAARRVGLGAGATGACRAAAPIPSGAGTGGRAFRLAVVADGDLLAVYLGDELRLLAPALRPSGGVGLAVEGGAARFRELTLRPLA